MSENAQITTELSISPKKIRARKGDFQVTISNKEKLTNTYHLKASDPDGLCTYNFNTDTITVEAGGIAKVTLIAGFKKTQFTGASKVCNFTVTAAKTTGEANTVEGQLECPAMLPVWALAAGGLLVVAIIAVVVVLASSGDNSDQTPLNTSTTTTTVTTKPSPSINQTTQTSTTSTTTTQITSSFITTTATSSPITTMTTATPTPTITTTTVTIPNIAGQWRWNLTVTVATGACAGEEGPQSPRIIQITQNGKDVTMSGFLSSNPSTSISGNITFDDSTKHWVVKFSGSYAEDQGITTTNYILVLNSTFDEMTGDENWDWSGSCPGSKSTVVAKKLT
jgi:hypothetical protein